MCGNSHRCSAPGHLHAEFFRIRAAQLSAVQHRVSEPHCRLATTSREILFPVGHGAGSTRPVARRSTYRRQCLCLGAARSERGRKGQLFAKVPRRPHEVPTLPRETTFAAGRYLSAGRWLAASANSMPRAPGQAPGSLGNKDATHLCRHPPAGPISRGVKGGRMRDGMDKAREPRLQQMASRRTGSPHSLYPPCRPGRTMGWCG